VHVFALEPSTCADASPLAVGSDAWLALMHAYGVAGFADKARGVLSSMKAAGVAPTADAYRELIGAYGRAGRPEEAASLFRLLQSTSSKGEDIAAFNELLSAFSENNEV
jgi:pentatricopeptide repeat protein